MSTYVNCMSETPAVVDSSFAKRRPTGCSWTWPSAVIRGIVKRSVKEMPSPLVKPSNLLQEQLGATHRRCLPPNMRMVRWPCLLNTWQNCTRGMRKQLDTNLERKAGIAALHFAKFVGFIVRNKIGLIQGQVGGFQIVSHCSPA